MESGSSSLRAPLGAHHPPRQGLLLAGSGTTQTRKCKGLGADPLCMADSREAIGGGFKPWLSPH